MRVLIVEDDRAVAEAIQDGVQLASHEVCGIAGTFEQAVALARLTRPDLAIIDVELGGGPDGIEIARRLAKMTKLAVMFMTGYPNRLRSVDIGHAWMAKPYRVLDLINALEAVYAVAENRPITGRIPPDLHLIPQRA